MRFCHKRLTLQESKTRMAALAAGQQRRGVVAAMLNAAFGRPLLGAATLVAITAAAAAQAPQRAPCTQLPPPFQPTEANQIKREELQRRLQGKTMVHIRPRFSSEGQRAGDYRYRTEFRADGSIVVECRFRRPNRTEWEPCRGFGPEGSQTRDRDVGTWRLDGDQIVMQRTRYGIEESRVTLHAEGRVLAARRIAGAPCMPGPIALE